MRYILDLQTGRIHDRRTIIGECNLDDLAPEHRQEIDKEELINLISPSYDEGSMGYEESLYKLCDHCFAD